MDPNENLNEQLELAKSIWKRCDAGRSIATEDTARLAELVLALDDWLAKGGFLPARWQR